ncbi:MAG: putative DsbA family dithiol-disulfide isomerase [Paracoccaceae bacterium]|jgi:predicted DsbA family dithiol-disulfide isomerase
MAVRRVCTRPNMPDTSLPITVQVDIVSDVVCPWCIVGYLQLMQALEQTGITATPHWHPFELNPDMPATGENLRDHIMRKYGSTPEQSQAARDNLTALGADLGFAFNFSDASHMVNTFRAHQLLDWAAAQDLQHPLKLALFKAYFTDGLDVSDDDILVGIAASVGLNATDAQGVLTAGTHAAPTREKQTFWTGRGIQGVPAMVFAGKYLLTGAQGAENYANVLQRCVQDAAHDHG